MQQYGSDEELHALADRIKETLSGVDKLTDNQVLMFAQYCRVTDVNPWRGEAYPFIDSRGEFHIVDGYKALVRWAKRQAPYSDKYELVTEGLAKDDIGYRCWILRNDALPILTALVQSGLPGREAFEIAATSAIGVVTKNERWSRKYNKEISPPTGWTWDQVAQKRALKNALNLSHGAPSPQELAAGSWVVNDTQTLPEDWQQVTARMPAYEREAIAEGTAQLRKALEHSAQMQAQGFTAKQALEELGFEPPEWMTEEPTGDPFLNGDAQPVEGTESEPEPPAPRAMGLEGVDLDYVPEGIDDWGPRMWGKFYFEARKLGFANDHHVMGALGKVYKMDKWDESKAEGTYRTAWNLLQDYQRSKVEGK